MLFFQLVIKVSSNKALTAILRNFRVNFRRGQIDLCIDQVRNQQATVGLSAMTEFTMDYLTADSTRRGIARFRSLVCCPNVLVRVNVV